MWATSLDGIPDVFLNNCATSLCLPFCHIFYSSIKNGQIPEQWHNAIVVPVHKKGVLPVTLIIIGQYRSHVHVAMLWNEL